MLALPMSVLFENPIVGSFTTLVLYVMLSVISRWNPYLLTTYMDSGAACFKAEIPGNELL